MSDRPEHSERSTTYRDEVRDTVIKSSLSGVAATVLAVTVWSPAGVGGMIGTSLASGFGQNPDSGAASDALANLAPYPAPITDVELREIRSQLRSTTRALRQARADTNAEIAHIRSIAASNHILSVAPMAEVAQVGAGLSVTPAAPAQPREVAAAAPMVFADAVTAQPIETATPAFTPISVEYSAPAAQLMDGASLSYGGGEEYGARPRDPNMELAALLFAF